jgi:8-oxo-dGTP pyrophosphatase MutT (NUDIX family)
MTNALILDNNNHVLLTHNCKNGNDRYEFSGGKVNPGEDPEEATIRENKEELGIDIEILGIFGDYETFDPCEGKFLCRTYFARITKGIPKPLEKDKMDYCKYVNYNQLEELARAGTLVPNLIKALSELKKIIS